jgi:hypothetical protein
MKNFIKIINRFDKDSKKILLKSGVYLLIYTIGSIIFNTIIIYIILLLTLYFYISYFIDTYKIYKFIFEQEKFNNAKEHFLKLRQQINLLRQIYNKDLYEITVGVNEKFYNIVNNWSLLDLNSKLYINNNVKCDEFEFKINGEKFINDVESFFEYR